jgi:molybdopterin converting factor small subunit
MHEGREMPAIVRIHLLTPKGMLQEKVEIPVKAGTRLDRFFDLLDKRCPVEKGFFRSVLKGRRAVTVLLNGERLDIEENRKIEIREGDEVVVLSPVTGG